MEESVSNRIDQIMEELTILFPPFGIPDESKYPKASKFVGGFMIIVEIYNSDPKNFCDAISCILDEFEEIKQKDDFLSTESLK
jgi:hypothetical protein